MLSAWFTESPKRTMPEKPAKETRSKDIDFHEARRASKRQCQLAKRHLFSQ
ncbi:hypothetical protein DPMN_164105 [Dreissena polymorpha]|uniref:Uncharacterized protein n=1 Tax=Dreissena polymorpha TaxID=45954 RepID=A0A9D4IV96_DREPO|nr:hypothetical protein DPMN_164105 [Dreissena polymorpha]